jgi:hypothetical protein
MLVYDSRLMRRFAYGLLFVTTLASALRAGTITPGAPGADGNVVLLVTLPDGTTKTVTVPITKNIPRPPGNPPIPTSAIGKATAIFTALNNAKVPNIGYTNGNTTVVTPGRVTVTGDTTAEHMLVADLGLSLPGSPAFATLGFSGPLSPLGTDGLDSVFTASFGVDGTAFSSASIAYSQLSSPTADGLATGLYFELLAGLSPNLQADLHLNLSTDSITFDFAPGSGEYFVQTSNTSPGTSQYMDVFASAPEPVTFVLLGTGMILIGACRTRGRQGHRLSSQKTTVRRPSLT